MVVLPFAIDYVPQPTIGPFPMPSPTMYLQADAMHHLICGHAPYHHGILSANPVSLLTVGVFNCKRAFFTHLLNKLSGISRNPHDFVSYPEAALTLPVSSRINIKYTFL